MSDKRIKTLENSAVELTLTLPAERIEEAYSKRIKEYLKTAQLPGFRKGHVPASVMEAKFGESIRTESTFEVMEKYLLEEIEKLDKKDQPLGNSTPVLQNEETLMPFKKDQDIEFSVVYDIYPVFDLPEYKALEIEVPKVSVLKKDVDERLKKLQEENSMVIDKEGKAAKGDIVDIDYVEVVDGKENENTERKDFTFTIGSEYNYYRLDDEIVGHEAGETFTVEKSYPEDFEETALAGKSVTLNVKLNKVKYKDVPALDDEFAQDVKEEYETLDDLVKATRKELKAKLDERMEFVKYEALMNKLLETLSVEIPESMVKAQMDQAIAQYCAQIGIPEEQFLGFLEKQNITKYQYLENSREQFVTQIKKNLMAEAIMEAEKFEATDKETEAKLAEMIPSEITDPKIKEYYKSVAADQVKFDKERALIIKENKFSNGEKMEYAAFMNLDPTTVGMKEEEEAEAEKEEEKK